MNRQVYRRELDGRAGVPGREAEHAAGLGIRFANALEKLDPARVAKDIAAQFAASNGNADLDLGDYMLKLGKTFADLSEQVGSLHAAYAETLTDYRFNRQPDADNIATLPPMARAHCMTRAARFREQDTNLPLAILGQGSSRWEVRP